MYNYRKHGINSPCYNCPDRYVGCHGKCDKYKQFKIKLEEFNEKQKNARFYRN